MNFTKLLLALVIAVVSFSFLEASSDNSFSEGGNTERFYSIPQDSTGDDDEEDGDIIIPPPGNE